MCQYHTQLSLWISYFLSTSLFLSLSSSLSWWVLHSNCCCKMVKQAHPLTHNVKWRYNLTAMFAHILTMMSHSGRGHSKCNAAKTVKMSGKDTSVHPLPEETSRSFFSLLHYLESLQHNDTNINFQIAGSGYFRFGIHRLQQSKKMSWYTGSQVCLCKIKLKKISSI